MPITVVSASTGGTPATTLDLPPFASVVAGDLLVVFATSEEQPNYGGVSTSSGDLFTGGGLGVTAGAPWVDVKIVDGAIIPGVNVVVSIASLVPQELAAIAILLHATPPGASNLDFTLAFLDTPGSDPTVAVGPSGLPPVPPHSLFFSVVATADTAHSLTPDSGWTAVETVSVAGVLTLSLARQSVPIDAGVVGAWTQGGSVPYPPWAAGIISFAGITAETDPDGWILLNDAPAAARVRRENTAIQIHDVLNNAPNTARLTVQGQPGGPGPLGGSSIEILDPATSDRIYKGSLQTIAQTYDGLPDQLHWDVDAVDAIWRLNKYRPFGTFVEVSASDVATALIADFAPGFTAAHVQTTLAPITITFDGAQTLSEALTAIASAIGAGHWYVDYDDDLHLFRSVPPSFDVPEILPPGPLTGVTVSEGSDPLSLTPGYVVLWVAFRYADAAISSLGPSSNVLANAGKVWQIDDLPIGDPDLTHGAVVARLVYFQFLSNFAQTGATNPPRPQGLFVLDDNTTTSVTYAFLTQTTPPVQAIGTPPLVGAFPLVPALPTGPTPAVTVTVEAWTETPALAPVLSDPGGSGDLVVGVWYEYVYTFSAAVSATDHSQETIPSPIESRQAAASGRMLVQVPHAVDDTGILWVFCYRSVSPGFAHFLIAAAQPYSSGGTYAAEFDDGLEESALGAPVRPAGAVWDASVTGLTYDFALTGVYDDGVESLPGPWSDPVTDQVVGSPLRKFHLADLPVVDAYTDDLSVGHPCVYRKLYARISLVDPFLSVTFVHVVVGWLIVPDNTTTEGNDDGRWINVAYVGFHPTPLPAAPRVDGPDLEDDDPPDPIDADSTTLLDTPPIALSEDHSQLRTRVFGRGAGTSVLVGAAIGAVGLAVADVSLFEPAGGHLIIGATVLAYASVGGVGLVLTTPLLEAIAAGASVQLWVQRDDLVAQGALGAVELDAAGNPTDGVHEFTVIDTSLRSVAALNARCDAELALFSRPIRTVVYATRDPKSKSGQQVAIDLTDPPIVGTFVIQDVTIDQIHIQDALVARYRVTASSVRFTLDDFLQRVLLSNASSASTGGGSGSAGPPGASGAAGATGATGATGPTSAWGTVSGTLSDQTDLATALAAKVPTTRTVNGHALSADVVVAEADIANLVTHLAAKEATANKNAASGYAGLDGSSKLTGSQQVYGSAANTAAQGNDSRLSDARTPTAHASSHAAAGSDPVTLSESQVTGLTTDLAAKAIATRAIVSGAGLTGGGDLSADRTLAVGAGTGITVNADDIAVQYGATSTTACVGNDSRLSNARTPTAHASTHQPGGTDAMAVDAAAATGSLRTLGTAATSAAAGNDSRLSDARTPTAHATSHKSGGSDAIKLDELAAPTDITTLNASSTLHGLQPKSPADATKFLNGAATPAYAAVKESDLATTDVTTNDVTSTKHGLAPKAPADATKFLNGAATPAYAQVKDSDLATTDVTTNDASTAKHGFMPKLDNNVNHFWTGTGTQIQVPLASGVSGDLPVANLSNGTFTVIAARTDTGAVNNWAPALDGNTYVPWAGTSDAAFTGLAGGVAGQIVRIKNTGSKIATFAHNSGSSSAGNKFFNPVTSAPTPVAPRGWIAYQHDGTQWQQVAHEQGAWIVPVFSAGDYTALAPMTITMDSGDVVDLRYKLSGTKLAVSWALGFFSLGGTASSEIRMKIPGGFTANGTFTANFQYNDNGGGFLFGPAYVSAAGVTIISLYKAGFGAANWTLSTNNTQAYGQTELEVQ